MLLHSLETCVVGQVRATKGNAILQSQSSTEVDVKEETTSPTPAASVEPAVKAEPDAGASTPSSAGDFLHIGHIFSQSF